ncbi:alpha/beta hydrolase family protein [Streptomyces sp. BBFR51]|uniref:alpha/beta hydrolase family protein n=1 Tax=Streptomyces sp. BBFR51 TaxID=3372856 RepID=UPI0037DD32DB
MHGGPWDRDSWGFNPLVQLLANRGYAVLQVNFRSSTGYGKSFMKAGIGELAGKMHDDLIDGVNWAIQQGYADPDRVAIVGGSYGGYAALVGVTFTPDVFAAAVDIFGVCDLANFLRNQPEFVRPALAANWFRWVGDPADPQQEADMLARSPISRWTTSVHRYSSPKAPTTPGWRRQNPTTWSRLCGHVGSPSSTYSWRTKGTPSRTRRT